MQSWLTLSVRVEWKVRGLEPEILTERIWRPRAIELRRPSRDNVLVGSQVLSGKVSLYQLSRGISRLELGMAHTDQRRFD